MLKGFKDFVLRGNVVELAVGLVIGLAFTAVVNSIVTAVVKPIVSAAGGSNTNGLGFSLKHTQGVPHGSALDVLGKSTFVDISAVINAIIVFLITAAVVYLIFVYPMNKLAERRARGLEPEPEARTEDVLLLEQIRDLLSAQQQRPPSTNPGGATTA